MALIAKNSPARRKLKFKDGTMGSYTPQERPSVTFFKCERGEDCSAATVGDDGKMIPAFLNTSELHYGNVCTACLAADKLDRDKEQEKELKRQQKKNIANMENQFAAGLNFMPDIIPLEKKTVNYIGKDYVVEVYNSKGSAYPHICITDPDGIIVYKTNTQYACKEGRDVFMYCIKNVDENNYPIIPANSI